MSFSLEAAKSLDCSASTLFVGVGSLRRGSCNPSPDNEQSQAPNHKYSYIREPTYWGHIHY